MKRFFYLSKVLIIAAIILGVNFNTQAQTTFNYTGSVQYYTVPAGVTALGIDAIGGSGGAAYINTGSNPVTLGGRVLCNLAVTAGQVLNVFVGEAGPDWSYVIQPGVFNGGGASSYYAAGGGGASDIRIGGVALSDRVVVAGGGGGGGDYSNVGGDGGGLTGGTGQLGAGGGTQTGPGAGGGNLGTLGSGGDGQSYSGGGGGGYWGGNGGVSLGGGGGGSSYTDATLATSVVHTQGYSGATGNGQVVITVLNIPPTFVLGSPSGFQVCQDATSYDFTALMVVNDADNGQTETWTVLSGPANGLLSGFPATATSSGGAVTPSTLTYSPIGGYSGPDAFTVQVDDGAGGTATMIVNVTVNPTPVMVAVLPQKYCNNDNTVADTFSSNVIGTTYSWTNDNTSIGLGAASVPGMGDTLQSFTATNTVSFSDITGNITVTPTANGCLGIPQSFTITVHPVADVFPAPANQAICNTGNTVADTFSSDVSGTTYAWANDNTSIGLGAASAPGMGDTLQSFMATNSTSSDIMGTITVTPTANGCVGTPKSFTITVHPTPMLSSTLTPAVTSGAFICDSTPFQYIPASATPSAITYTWSRAAVPGISNPAGAGNGTINDTLVNTGTALIPVAWVYTLTLTGTTCYNIQTVTDTVAPILLLTSNITDSVCNTILFTYVPMSATPGNSYSWIRKAITGISNLTASGFGTSNPSEMLNDTTVLPVVDTYYYTIINHGCSNTENVNVKVQPTPKLNSGLTPAAICDSTLFTYYSASSTPGVTYSWSRDTVFGIKNSPASGSNDTIREILINTYTYPVSVTYIDTLNISGCINTQSVTVSVNPRPMLTGSVSDTICNNSLFTYTATSATLGTTFSWSRPTVTGISPSSNSGTGSVISETLTNTNATPTTVIYYDTLTFSGCQNIDQISLVVNPTPKLSSAHNAPAICDSAFFNYTPMSATGSTFAWSRAYVPGISVLAGSGFDNPNEQLINTTNFNVTAVYVYTVTINGCSGTDSVNVVVRPVPVLSSLHSASVCSSTPFTYVPQSLTPGVGFTWSRGNITGITPATGSGVGNINETLVNATTATINTIYNVVLTISGTTCKHSENVNVAVNPGPATAPVISILPAVHDVCFNTHFMNFAAATPPPAGLSYIWSTENATIMATSANKQNALVSFNSPNTTAQVILSYANSNGCNTPTGYSYNIGSSSASNPQVVYYNGQFICLENDVASYQWGYDDVQTLDSTLIPGEVNQVYFNSVPDLLHHYYWLMTTSHGGCLQKTYYNTPTGITNINEEIAGIKVYPNPATNNINVEINTAIGGNIQVEILNLLGQKLNTTQAIDKRATINIAGLPAGYYLVDCYRDGMKIGTAKFIKN